MLASITAKPSISLAWGRERRGSVARSPWSVNDGSRPFALVFGRRQIAAMKVIIQGKQLRLSRGLKSYAQKHVVGPLNRFYDNEAAELRVELGDVNGSKRSEERRVGKE